MGAAGGHTCKTSAPSEHGHGPRTFGAGSRRCASAARAASMAVIAFPLRPEGLVDLT